MPEWTDRSVERPKQGSGSARKASVSILHGLMKVVCVMGVLLEKVPSVWLIMVIADDIIKNLTCQRRDLLVL